MGGTEIIMTYLDAPPDKNPIENMLEVHIFGSYECAILDQPPEQQNFTYNCIKGMFQEEVVP